MKLLVSGYAEYVLNSEAEKAQWPFMQVPSEYQQEHPVIHVCVNQKKSKRDKFDAKTVLIWKDSNKFRIYSLGMTNEALDSFRDMSKVWRHLSKIFKVALFTGAEEVVFFLHCQSTSDNADQHLHIKSFFLITDVFSVVSKRYSGCLKGNCKRGGSILPMVLGQEEWWRKEWNLYIKSVSDGWPMQTRQCFFSAWRAWS